LSKSADASPDISDILQRKAEGRKDGAARTLGEKIARMEAMQERLEPLKRSRETREGFATGLADSDVSKTK
jgi:hypothetical protein